jgi:hypothetical protein
MLWTSIDETKESPLTEDKMLFDRIRNIQEEKRQISMVEQFLTDRIYQSYDSRLPRSGINNDVEEINATDFFLEYTAYEKLNSPKAEMNSTKFGRTVVDVSKLIPGLVIEKVKGKTVLYKITKT